MKPNTVNRIWVACLRLAPLFAPVHVEPPPQLKIVVFDFELDDFRDSASSPQQQGDGYNLLLATEALKRELTTGGKYTVLNAHPTTWLANSFPELHLCNGCEAEVARKFGADRSLLVVVTRVSMTDYVMSYQIRDAQSGNVVSSGTSDLRMGANYSWARGATWLARNSAGVVLHLRGAQIIGEQEPLLGRVSGGRLQVRGQWVKEMALPFESEGPVHLELAFANRAYMVAAGSGISVRFEAEPNFTESLAC